MAPPVSARVLALVVHPYCRGAPHRLKWFRQIFERLSSRKDVLFWTGSQILDWYLSEEARIAAAGLAGAPAAKATGT